MPFEAGRCRIINCVETGAISDRARRAGRWNRVDCVVSGFAFEEIVGTGGARVEMGDYRCGIWILVLSRVENQTIRSSYDISVRWRRSDERDFCWYHLGAEYWRLAFQPAHAVV